MNELEVHFDDRCFRIESVKVEVRDEPNVPTNVFIHVYRVWEDDVLLNAEELQSMDFDFFDSHEEAIDAGFHWLRKQVK